MAQSKSIYEMVRATCRACGVPDAHLEDVASDITLHVRRVPKSKQYPELVRGIQQWIARTHGIEHSALPRTVSKLIAIGQYQAAQGAYREEDAWDCENGCGDGGAWFHSFDMHSIRFAVENGVCPQCSTVGDFTEDEGSCRCGFRYGALGVAHEC